MSTRKGKNDVFEHPLTLTYIYKLSFPHIEHVIFVFIHSMLLHNYIIFNVPFFSSFFFCTCVSLWCSIYFSFGRLQNTWMCVEDSLMHYHTYVWEKGEMKKVSFFCIMIRKSVMMILLLWVLKRTKCNNPAKDYVNDM